MKNFGILLLSLVAAIPVNASGRQNIVASPPLMIVPENLQGVGQPFTVTNGETVIRYSVFHPPRALLAVDATLDVAGKSFSLNAEEALSPVILDFGVMGHFNADAAVFCTDAQNNFMATVAAVLTKYGAETRLCLVDDNNDKKFDLMFLAGAKAVEDRGVRQIEELSYSIESDKPTLGEHIELTFRFFGNMLTSDAMFQFQHFSDGKKVGSADDVYLINAGKGEGWINYQYGPRFKPPKIDAPFNYRIGALWLRVTKMEKTPDRVTFEHRFAPQPMLLFIANASIKWAPEAKLADKRTEN